MCTILFMYQQRKNILLGSIFLLIISCKTKMEDSTPLESGIRIPVIYAKGFTIYDYGDYVSLTVRDPLDTNKIFQTYFLCHGESITEGKDGINIKVPLNDIACLSTTHIGFLEVLNLEDKLIAFSGSKYIYSDKITGLVNAGKIAEVGNEGGLNTELLISLKPDIIMAYDIGDAEYDHFQKLKELQLLPVLNNEYLELTPLGQAEWIKFVAAFFDKMEEANKIFEKIAEDYNSIKASTALVENKPTVFTGLAFKGEWTIPGGNSFAANYLKDAGASYLWLNDTKTGNFAVSLEEMIAKGKDGEYWLHAGAADNLNELKEGDERYQYFSALKNGNVFNNNNRVNKNGGNDYWEGGIINPQIVLKDLVKIFHPELMIDHDFVYYKKLY